MRHPVSLLVICFALSSCVTASESYLPDGSKGQLVTCGGALFSYTDCLKRAGEICGSQGYQIITADGNATPYSSSSGGFNANPYYASGGFSSSSGMITNRSVLVKCGTAAHTPKKKAKK